MFLSDISINRPVFTTMVMLCLMMLGIMGGRNLGVDLFPDVAFPFVSITTVYRGAAPAEVERLVSKQIEEAVSSINGVDEVKSFSRDSHSLVVIQFKLETDIKTATSDVRERLASIASELPSDSDPPIIQRLDPTALPILTYAVSGSSNSAVTRKIIEDNIKPKIEAVEGVAAVNVIGGLEREIHVYVNRSEADALGLSLDRIAQQIKAAGTDVPAGKLYLPNQDLLVKTEAHYSDLHSLEQLVLASHQNGSQVLLSDIARIEDGYKEDRIIAKVNGVDAVTFEVQKQGGKNTVAIADSVYKVLKQMERTLPNDMKFVKVIDNSTFIRANIREVAEALIFGGLMAILVIFLFMLDWRSTFISSLALPTSVVTTFFVMWWLNFSFNMMTLLGLSLAIGLLIDDAVVVRENIYRHMEQGKDPITAARIGTKEIALAVMATTLAIVAVFVPIAFMSGIVGRMFKQFGLTVSAAVLVSLFVSFTLDPMMSARVVKPVPPGNHERLLRHRFYGPIVRFFDLMNERYRGILVWSLAHPKTILISATITFIASLALVSVMGKEFVNNGDRGEFRVNLELASGTPLTETEKIVHEVEELIRQNREVKTLFTTIGSSNESHKASIRVYTTKEEERRGISQADIENDLRKRLSVVPGMRFNISELGMIEGAEQELAIMLYVRGEDYDTLRRLADQTLVLIKEVPGTTDADTSYRMGKPELSIVPNRAKAFNLGVNIMNLSHIARLALEGEVVAKYKDADRDLDIRMQLAQADRMSKADLGELTVGSHAGHLVKFADVATLRESQGPATIERMDRRRQILLSANVVGRSLGEVSADIEKAIQKLDKPEGYDFEFSGQTQRMKETFSNMLLALLVAIIFIYFVLASQFESFIHPFTIMATLPLAIVGALFLLFLTGFPIGMSSMIGIVLLMGLVTKNAILLVDYTNQLRNEGKSIKEALIEAGPTRLRPILMTSAAMVLGMLPTAIKGGEGAAFRAPMATAVIGGVVVSTFLTLVVVPVVYVFMDRFNFGLKRKTKEQPSS